MGYGEIWDLERVREMERLGMRDWGDCQRKLLFIWVTGNGKREARGDRDMGEVKIWINGQHIWDQHQILSRFSV